MFLFTLHYFRNLLRCCVLNCFPLILRKYHGVCWPKSIGKLKMRDLSLCYCRKSVTTPASLKLMTCCWPKNEQVALTKAKNKQRGGRKSAKSLGNEGDDVYRNERIRWARDTFCTVKADDGVVEAERDLAVLRSRFLGLCRVCVCGKESTGSKYRATLGRLISTGDAHLSRILCRRLTHQCVCVCGCARQPARLRRDLSHHLHTIWDCASWLCQFPTA